MALLSGMNRSSVEGITISPDAFLIFILAILTIGLIVLFIFLIDLIVEKKKYYKSLRKEKEHKS